MRRGAVILSWLLLAVISRGQSPAAAVLMSSTDGETANWMPSWYGQEDSIGGIGATNVGAIATTDNGWLLDGTNNYILCGKPPSIAIGTDRYYSMSAWVWMPSIPTSTYYMAVCGVGISAAKTRWVMWVRNDATNHAFVSLGQLGYQYGTGSGGNLTYLSNTWYHIAMTLDRMGSMRFYRNGTNLASCQLADSPVANLADSMDYTSSGADFGIGAYAGDGNYKFKGIIKNVCVWKNRELTSDEVVEIYNRGPP